MLESVGIYIHIPFCKKKCDYCDFYSLAGCDSAFMDSYLQAMIKQLDDYSIGGYKIKVDTIYIGGGTPSYFGGKRLSVLLKEIKRRFNLTRDVEITVEVNPESADKKLFKQLKKAGVNRVSMGVQSSDDDQLVSLGRLHDFSKACEAVELCKKYCTDNISLDLMYGLENQTMKSWEDSIEAVISLKPRHISCYSLTLEEGTPLFSQNPQLPDDDYIADMYLVAIDTLENNGYMQYEISNFALKGYESAHNSRYWDVRPYIGIGAAAHSFYGDKRYSNIRNAKEYIKLLENGESVIVDADDIPIKNRSGEYVMLKLRTVEGISESVFERRFKQSFQPYANKLQKYIASGHALYEAGVYRLTPRGFFVSNTIISDVLDIS